MATTALAVDTGSLLSSAGYHAITDPNLLGFGHADPICALSCFTQIDAYNFGLGVERAESWILQNPELTAFSATEAYLPSQGIAIAVAVTYLPPPRMRRATTRTPLTRSSGRSGRGGTGRPAAHGAGGLSRSASSAGRPEPRGHRRA